MKKFLFILFLFALVPCTWAQKREWSSPFVGYSTSKILTLDKVEFDKSKTFFHVTATVASGSSISVSPDAYLSANGKRYAIQKVSVLGVGKQYTMPDSGRVNFTMQFEPLPADTRLMHFSEGEVEGGWTLCNIRECQDDLVTEIPQEWKNVTYPDKEYLPDSKFSDDSTYIQVKILNYVPEVGRKIEVEEFPIAFDITNHYKEYDIAVDGTATIDLHPYFPVTIHMRLGKGTDFPLLIVPGKNMSMLMDLGKGGTDATVAFKGELAKTNYELNVLGAKDFLMFDKSNSYFDSMVNSKKNIRSEWNWHLIGGIDRINDSNYSPSTKEWMTMNAEYEHASRLFRYNLYIVRRVKGELEKTGSSILENSYLWNGVREGLEIHPDESRPYSFTYSKKMTFCPDLSQAWALTKRQFKDANGNVNTYNKDIHEFYWAIIDNETSSYEAGEKIASGINDTELKAFYPIVAKRWGEYVKRLNTIPHIHFDQHGDVKTGELKNKVLEDYRGKNVVFLVYDREPHGTILDELEQDFITKANDQKVVFIHIDTRSASMWGTGSWADAAIKRKGEHYGGRRNRYDSMFQSHNPFFDGQFYYELYAPDGTCTLQTTDKKKAFDAISKLVK